MLKKIKQTNSEIDELIHKNITYYTLSFITLIFAFLFFYIGVISIYNISEINKNLNKNYSLNIYLNNNVSQNSIEKIEKNILEMKNIDKIIYIDKNSAIKKLVKELGLNTKNIDNPLLNSFDVKVIGEEALDQTKIIVDEIVGVKEVLIDQNNTHQLNKQISKNKQIIFWLFLIILLPIIIMIFNIMHSTIVSQNHDMEAKLYLGLDKKLVLRPYYFINNVKFISANIIGGLIFLNLYEIIGSQMTELKLVGIFPVGIIVGIFLVLTSLIFPFLSSNLIKIKR